MRPIASLLVCLLAAFGLTGCVDLHHSWHWRAADLDRNKFDLALYRGATTGERLAEHAGHGEPVAASGSAERARGGDLRVVVRYGGGEDSDTSDKWGSAPEPVCYEFTTPDGYDVEFDRTDCPA